MHPAGLLDGPQHNNIIRFSSKINPTLTPHIHQPHIHQPLILHLHHHFLQTRPAGSCAAELQAHTVFRK